MLVSLSLIDVNQHPIKLQFYGDKLNILYYKPIYFLNAWAVIQYNFSLLRPNAPHSMG